MTGKITIFVHHAEYEKAKDFVAANTKDFDIEIFSFVGGVNNPNETPFSEIKIVKKELIKCN